ncbi:MAG: adenosine deaminase [Candidatus Azotimanducaceae bacterium]|jgi:adenosine deaminase
MPRQFAPAIRPYWKTLVVVGLSSMLCSTFGFAQTGFKNMKPEDAGGQNLSLSHRYGRDDPNYVQNVHHFIHAMPKAELHVHYEGTLAPTKILELSKRNSTPGIPDTIDGIKKMLAGSVLTQFLDGLAKARSTMVTEQDFYEVAWEFAVRQMENQVVYTELMFDPQGHTSRGIEFDTFMRALVRAKQDANDILGIRIELSMQFHRDKSRASALETLADAERWKDHILGVGMDNGPQAGYAEKLQPAMEKAREMGFRISGHIDRYELDYDKNLNFLLNTLNVGRVDHGINIMDTPELILIAKDREVTFTVCGATLYSDNLHLYEDSGFKLYTRRIDEMTEAGLQTTINTDDPGYFIGFYLSDMIRAFHEENQYSKEELIDFQRRAFKGAWMSAKDKAIYLAQLDQYASDTSEK